MIRLLIVVVCGIVGLGAAIKSRFGALLFYVWYAIFRPQDYLWFSIAEYRPSLIIGIGLVVSSVVSGVLPFALHPLWLGPLVVWLCGLMAHHNAVAPDISWDWIILLGTILVVSSLVVRLTTSKEKLRLLVAVLAGSFAFFSAKAGVASLLAGGSRFFDGLATGAFSDNNGYAVGCVMIAPLLLALSRCATSRWVRIAWMTAAAATTFTVISTFSRGGFLALAAASLTFISLQRRPLRKLVIATVLGGVALAVVPIPEGYFDRLQTIQTYEEIEETSAISRIHLWTVATHIAKDYPLGIGLWNFESIYDSYDTSDGLYGSRRAVHNSHLQALVETGWLGGFVWEATMLGALWYAWRVRARASAMTENGPFFRVMAEALFTSQVGFLVGGTFVSLAYNDLTWLTLGCVAALDRLALAEKVELATANRLQPATFVYPRRGESVTVPSPSFRAQ